MGEFSPGPPQSHFAGGWHVAMMDATTAVTASWENLMWPRVNAVVQQGKVVEQGTHDALVNIPGGPYATLVQLQMSAAQQASKPDDDLDDDADGDSHSSDKV